MGGTRNIDSFARLGIIQKVSSSVNLEFRYLTIHCWYAILLMFSIVSKAPR